jgi:hypothetical protein
VLNARSRSRAKRAGPQGRLTYHLAIGFDGALIGYMVSGFFVTVLYYPYFWINLAMTVALNTVAKRLPDVARTRSRTRGRFQVVAPPSAQLADPGLQPALPHRWL